ncbi:MAG: CBS domain-containing protein [Gammaproteobacteria bacterium]
MHHAPLPIARVTPAPNLPRRPGSAPGSLGIHDPASLAMTDFRHEPALTIESDVQVDLALRDMIHLGVRALLVAHGDELVGLITAYDIQGERPGQFLLSPSCDHSPCLRRDIHVGDIMTPWRDLEVLTVKAVEAATVGSLLDAMTSASLTHLVVIEDSAGNGVEVRGLISRTQVERLLGYSSVVRLDPITSPARG